MRIVRGILAIIAGVIAGSVVNMGIILLSALAFAIPEGMNLWDPESVKAHAHLLTPQNYIAVLIAHQLGALVGAFVAAKLASGRKMIFALAIGVWFLLGGIYAATMIPAPAWFLVVDLGAYIPMALIGGKLAGGTRAARAGTAGI